MKKTTPENKLTLPVCKFYARGYCARGSTCYYSHAQTPQLSLPQLYYPNEEFFSFSEICPSYSEGFCCKGFGCPLQHIQLGPEQVLANCSLVIGIGT